MLTDKVCQPFMTRINVLISLCQTRLVDVPPAQCLMRIDRINRNRAFFKKYYEKWSMVVRASAHQLQPNLGPPHLIVLVLHRIQRPHYIPAEARPFVHFDVVRNCTCECVATIIMILATLAEFSYIPTTWNNTFHLTRPPCHSRSYGWSYALYRHHGVFHPCYLELCPLFGCLAPGSK